MPQLPQQIFLNDISLQGHSNEKLIGATNSNIFFQHTHASNKCRTVTNVGNFLWRIRKNTWGSVYCSVCDQNKPNMSSLLLEEGGSIFSMCKLRNSPHFKWGQALYTVLWINFYHGQESYLSIALFYKNGWPKLYNMFTSYLCIWTISKGAEPANFLSSSHYPALALRGAVQTHTEKAFAPNNTPSDQRLM